jgi:hypothetical protein
MSQIDPVRITPSYFCEINFTIMLSPMSMFPHWCLSFWLFHEKPAYMRAICPTHIVLLDFITFIFGEAYIIKFLNVQISQSSDFSALLDPDIHLRTLFSNTLHLCSSLKVRDKVSHPYKMPLHVFHIY